MSSYPNKVTWKIIEKHKNDAIYEWILNEPHKNIPPEHEISRAFLTKTGFHRVGFTKKDGKMSPEEREKWIELLKKNTSIVSLQEALKLNGLSMVNKLKDSLSLGTNFHNWAPINTYSSDHGYTLVCYIPPSQTGSYLTECLEIVTMPNLQELSIDQFFKKEKAYIQEHPNKKGAFQVLKKSSEEIIYTYSHPIDHLQLNTIVRIFLTDHGYYSISYKRGLAGLMEKEEVLKWQEKLKSINVKSTTL